MSNRCQVGSARLGATLGGKMAVFPTFPLSWKCKMANHLKGNDPIGGTHFSLPWLWEEGYTICLVKHPFVFVPTSSHQHFCCRGSRRCCRWLLANWSQHLDMFLFHLTSKSCRLEATETHGEKTATQGTRQNHREGIQMEPSCQVEDTPSFLPESLKRNLIFGVSDDDLSLVSWEAFDETLSHQKPLSCEPCQIFRRIRAASRWIQPAKKPLSFWSVLNSFKTLHTTSPIAPCAHMRAVNLYQMIDIHTDACAHIRLCEEALFECRQHCGNQASYERVKGICERLQFSDKLMRRLDQECSIPIRVSVEMDTIHEGCQKCSILQTTSISEAILHVHTVHEGTGPRPLREKLSFLFIVMRLCMNWNMTVCQYALVCLSKYKFPLSAKPALVLLSALVHPDVLLFLLRDLRRSDFDFQHQSITI